MKDGVIAALEAGAPVDDRAFDQLLSRDARKFARALWTPTEAARRAAQWLVTRSGATVLDVGSGVGKFCIVGALTTPGHFTGIERNAAQVAEASALAHRLHARAKFLAGDALAADWTAFDGIYLYNPFTELADSEAAARQLAATPRGTRVAVLNGIGVAMPAALHLVDTCRIGPCMLELWLRD